MQETEAGAELWVVIDRAARAVAYESGLSAVTLGRVSARAGVAPVTVAQYEPSMTALAARMFRIIATTELRDVAEGTAVFSSPLDALWFVTDELTGGSHGNENWVWADAWTSGARSKLIARVARDVTTAWTAFVADLITAAIRERECGPVDAGFVAQAFVALVDGSSAHSVTGSGTPSQRADMLKTFLTTALGLSTP